MKFRYSARTKTGELQVGYVDAAKKEEATSVLASHELYILSIEEMRPPRWYHGFLQFFKRVKRKDLAIFTRQFATMLEAKISIHDVLNSLYYQTENPTLKEALFQISNDIDSGISLSQALGKQDHVFFEFFVNLIQTAEVTGQVEEAVGFLADYLEREMELVSRVKNALIYPVFVVGLSIIVGGILIGLVFPQITPLFEEVEFDLPLITSIFLGLGTFINEWWIAIVVVLIILTVMAIDYFRTEEGKAVFDQIILQLPLVGSLYIKMYVARFAEITSVLIKGGIPIAQAIEIGGHTLGSALYQEMLHEVAESVRRGELMSQSFIRYPKFFPPIVTQMIMVGEQTGKVDQMFARVARFYGKEVENIVANLVELIQPALMVVVGVFVGLLFAAILLPIYNLVQVIR
ncbi:MAG: type II secretion system F family protein [Patescibacteria group bacterium]